MIDKIILLNDQPIDGSESSREDGLGFSTYSDIIASTIKGTPGPFTIGIFGEWGTGKTSLLNLIKDKLSSDYNVIPVWFNAWMYEKEEHPLLPLIATIVKEIHKSNDFWRDMGERKDGVLNALKSVAYGFSASTKLKVPGFAEIEAGFVAKDMIERNQIISSDPLLDKSIYYNSFDRLSSINLLKNRRIVIFIDDLDRCFPDKAIKLLESIKLVLFQKGFVFVLGVARQVIEGYLSHKYKNDFGLEQFEGQKYLDKIVQLSFPIPPHTQRAKDFLAVLTNQLNDNDSKALSPILPIVGAACAYNPRGIVRFINNLLIDRAISNVLFSDSENIPIGFFAVTRGLQQRWIDVYELLISSEDLCQKIAEIERHSLADEDMGKNDSFSVIIFELSKDKDLQDFIFTKEGNEWLTNSGFRNFAIDFLKTQRQQGEEDKLYEHSPHCRVYELAKELNMTNKVLLDKLGGIGVEVRSHMSMLTKDEYENIINHVKNSRTNLT
ncbi:translation initiation factor IF-2 N-terminal domain-containing protein [Desulfobotulus mexicanus]|nr:translation initiation factor IF-2 N-terminal domain-containing protein [Desulfobotulus mexicanus]